MVKGMGDESGSAPWLSESRRRPSPATGSHPSPHVGGRHGLPLDEGNAVDEIGTVPETGRPKEENLRFRVVRRVVPRGTMDEVSSMHVLFPVRQGTEDALKIVPPRSSDPIMEGPTG